MICFMKQKLLEFKNSEHGLAYFEFAISVTFLMILFMGSIEVSRYALIVQKVENVANTMADITTQANPNTTPLTTSQMSQLMSAVHDLMSPYSSGTNSPDIKVIVSSVTQAGANNPVINWQYCTGGGSLAVNSRITAYTGSAAIGSAVVLPNNFTMNAGEEIVIAEVIYNYTPLLLNNKVVGQTQVYKTAIYLPRLGVLTAFSSTCP